MSNTKTGIEWCDVTWNPVTGCEKVSQGCKNCYAERVFDRMAQNPKAPMYHARKFTDVQVHPERLGDPLKWKKPKRVFVNSMSDLFHEDVSDEFISEVFEAMKEASQHQFLILTKRPLRMKQFIGNGQPLPNVGLGVSIEDQQTANERILILVETPAAIKCVSYEPPIGPVDFRKVPGFNRVGQDLSNWWVIAGGESGPNARPPHPDWFRAVRDQCKAAGVPFFFKQWGEWAPNCLCDTKHAHPTIERPSPGSRGCMFRCGKKRAGRLLDGVEHSEFPEVSR